MNATAGAEDFTRRQAETLYSEALILSDETRAYFEGEGRVERDRLPPVGRVQFACEALKATTRLLQVTAWLSARRRGDAEPPPLAEASASAPEMLGPLPSAARRLILAGIDLHERCGRLAAGTAHAVVSVGPARALLQRLQRTL